MYLSKENLSQSTMQQMRSSSGIGVSNEMNTVKAKPSSKVMTINGNSNYMKTKNAYLSNGHLSNSDSKKGLSNKNTI